MQQQQQPYYPIFHTPFHWGTRKNGVQLAFRSHQLAFKPEHKSSARFTLHKMPKSLSMLMEMEMRMAMRGFHCQVSTLLIVGRGGRGTLCGVYWKDNRWQRQNDIKGFAWATLKLHSKLRGAQRCRRTVNCELWGNSRNFEMRLCGQFNWMMNCVGHFGESGSQCGQPGGVEIGALEFGYMFCGCRNTAMFSVDLSVTAEFLQLSRQGCQRMQGRARRQPGRTRRGRAGQLRLLGTVHDKDEYA